MQAAKHDFMKYSRAGQGGQQSPASREALFKRLGGLEQASCPFQNLPESKKGRWGEGLTAEDMSKCRWLQPRLVAMIEFAEWTPANHLRHSKFLALRDDKDAAQVRRELPNELRR